VRVVRVDTAAAVTVKTSAVVIDGQIEYWTVARRGGEWPQVLCSDTLPEAMGRHDALLRELAQ
jgi:hypothetical protein